MNSLRFATRAAYLLVGVIFLHAGCAQSNSPNDADKAVIPLKILSYNVHLLPEVAAKIAGNRGDSQYRAKSIGKLLVDFDIAGLSEVFDANHSQTLFDVAQSASDHTFTIIRGPERTGFRLVGSGLAIVSCFPFEESHTISYQEASEFLDSGFKADGLAAKGALHARLRVSDQPQAYVDCFVTHLESRSAKARDSQIVEFTNFVANHAGDDPIIVMGDFNINGNPHASDLEKAQLESLRSKLTQKDARLIDAWEIAGKGNANTNEPVTEGGQRRIDYIFLSDKESAMKFLKPVEVTTLPFLDEKVTGGSLSDHSAVSCRAELVLVKPTE